jgi:hypothetical protein
VAFRYALAWIGRDAAISFSSEAARESAASHRHAWRRQTP